MFNITVGILAIIAGLIFCFRGYLAMRTVIGLWAGFVGFGVGATLFASITQQGLLTGPLSWVAAIAGALLLAWLAYAFYAAAVIITMGSVGYALGTTVAGLLGLPAWMYLPAGVAAALLLVLIALVTNLPAVLLIVVAAIGGASAIVTGVAFLVGLVPAGNLDPDVVAPLIEDHTWLAVAHLVLVIAGIVTQLRRRSTANLRASYP